MPLSVAHLARTLQTVLTDVADQAARDAGFVRRRRRVSGASFVQALVFGWLDDPDASLDDLAAAHALVAVPLSPQALDQRFTPAAADTLRRVLLRAVTALVAAQPTAGALLRRFCGVYLLDGTTIGLPAALAALWAGCGGRDGQGGAAALKVQLRWELLSGVLDGFTLQDGRASDATTPLNSAPLPAGALRLADLGYFDLDVLQGYAGQGVYWLTRLKHNTAVYVAGRPVRDLARWLRRRRSGRIDVAITVGAFQRLPCRLLAVRVPKAVERQRRERLRKEARDKGYKVRPERLALCGWSLWISNVPAEQLSLPEVEVLSRVRWQIELLFKLWKSAGQVDESASGKPYRVLCEVYAKLLAMVVQHWVQLLSWEGVGQRSLRRGVRRVRQYAVALALALGDGRALRRLLRVIAQALRHGLRINKRRRKPACFQLLARFDPGGDDETQAA
jgi:Transposase DDE domain